jgi:O-phosphoseryl-tRNA synthetase
MSRFDIKKIEKEADKDYEKAWLDSAKLLEEKGKLFSLVDKGKKHPLSDLIFKVRQILLELGFSETVVPMIIERSEVSRQFGPEAPVILDRIFFLAGLDRPDIGIDKKRIEQIKKLVPRLKDIKPLQDIFRRYKLGKITPDDFIETMMKELGLKEEEATALISLFEELRELKPIPSTLTLRSHLTAGWFSVLREMKRREPLPVQLFSIGPKFRREQRLDPTHLYESWTASVVVMAERMSLEDGQRLVKDILRRLGFGQVKLVTKKATSKYYAPQTEFEVFVKHPKTGEFLEVGDAGFYSPVPLSKYEIPYPVFNFGIGLERLLMIQTGEADMRALVYPYVYKPPEFSDAEIAAMLRIERGPETQAGKRIAKAVIRTAKRYADKPSPCEFKAFEGRLLGHRVRVRVIEPEAGTKLIGPAGFNEIYVYDGNIVGVPPRGWQRDKFLQRVRKRGVSTRIRYMDAFAELAAHEIEQAVRGGKRRVKVRVPIVKLLSDINLALEEPASRYITNKKKKIDVRGPVFTTVVAEIK